MRWYIMKKTCTTFAIVAASLAVAACSTPAFVSPVEVTRFTGDMPEALGQGTISIVPATGTDEQTLEFDLYRAEVAEELAALGYQVVEADGAQQALIGLQVDAFQPTRSNSPVSVGGGMGVGSYGSGVGLGLNIDLSGPPPEQIQRLLSVSIRETGGDQNLWEGRAGFTATGNSEMADPAAAADHAAASLFAGFPGNSGETIEVE